MSETEPELGLGIVQELTSHRVTIRFARADQTRQYARDNAPLRRVQFHPGDTIQLEDGTTLEVQAVLEEDGLLVYRGQSRAVPESALSEAASLNGPAERLRNGQVDPAELFDIRLAALDAQHCRRKSPLRGFLGGRIELIPHQLSIAHEVTRRLAPRVLLADEVGLGKTIEACLIVHRLLQTGRAERVLILVPEPLVYQWFVELLRRFNLWFHIVDEERCEAVEANDPGTNPFTEDQCVLSALPLLARTERRLRQALTAGWDLLVVDEAHHLGWTPDHSTPEYQVVEALARQTAGLLLLTATPEQLGLTSHFGRLRLLDPDRYTSLDAFRRESESYLTIARLAEQLRCGDSLEAIDIAPLRAIGSSAEDTASLESNWKRAAAGDAMARQSLLEDLIDRHGTGRVMFRNTRAVVTGFPKRVPHLHPLESPGRHVTSTRGGPNVGATSPSLYDQLAAEFAADTAAPGSIRFNADLRTDPRILWLSNLLRELGEAKVLLVCHTVEKAKAIDEALRTQIQIKTALFHEGLALVQRDRNAAWFSEPDGARLLIASEIGSEGRNFQFAHHLVLFDLPLDPEVLEQRIGRLDRIGQSSDVNIHVPFVLNSPAEVLARWYEEGLNAFKSNVRGARQLFEQFGARVHDLAQDFHETQETASSELARLIQETKRAAGELADRLEHGRDRLLELNSYRPAVAEPLVRAIRDQDQDGAVEDFMLTVFDHFNIQVEEIARRTYRLGSAGVFADSFPGLPTEGLTVTADRRQALSREDVQFLTWDHPLVTGAFDLILGSMQGNCSFAIWPDARTNALYLEAVYLLECVAPAALHMDRFLPPTPLRVMVDQTGRELGATSQPLELARQLKPGQPAWLLQGEFRDELLPTLLDRTRELAEGQAQPLMARARAEMKAQLEREIARLRALRSVNRAVRLEEIELLVTQEQILDEHLATARLRLEAVRLIQRGS